MITKEHITGTEVSKDFQTRGGNPVKIYDIIEGKVHGAAQDKYGTWHTSACDQDGVMYRGYEIDSDLVPIPEKREPMRGFAVIDKGAAHGLFFCGNRLHPDNCPKDSDAIPVREVLPNEIVINSDGVLFDKTTVHGVLVNTPQWGHNTEPGKKVRVLVVEVNDDE